MLFLPIDNAVWNGAAQNSSSLLKKQQQAHHQKKRAQRRCISKSSLALNKLQISRHESRQATGLLDRIHQRTDQSPNNSSLLQFTMKSSQNQNAYNKVHQNSRDAQELIEYMRKVQQRCASSQPQADLQNENSTISSVQTPSQQPQPKATRMLTTMSPSTKERLRKNLETFGSGDRTSVFPQQRFKAMGLPPPITQLLLPNHTKNAYSQVTQSSANRRRASATPGIYVAKPTIDQAMVLPYSRDRNDETLLFVHNASKPLVDGLRHVQNVPRARSRIIQRLLHPQQSNGGSPHSRKDHTSVHSLAMKLGTENVSTRSGNLTVSRPFASMKDLNQNQTDVKTETAEARKEKRRQMYLLANQQKECKALMEGSSRHITRKKSQHDDCQCGDADGHSCSRSRSREKFTQLGPRGHIATMTNSMINSCACCSSKAKLSKVNSHQSSAYQFAQERSEPNFTVKLCINCNRSVKLKPPSPRYAVIPQPLILERSPSPPAIITKNTQTQVGADLINKYRSQQVTQTQATEAREVQCQADNMYRGVDAETRMSHDRLFKPQQDGQAQTSHRLMPYPDSHQRPNTSLGGQRHNQKTYNFYKVQAQHDEMMNERKFVIYDRHEYQKLVNQREAKPKHFDAKSQSTLVPSSQGAHVRYNIGCTEQNSGVH